MSDDLERRLRSALHDAPLPGAPSSLRSALLTVPDAAPTALQSTSRWQRLPLALAAALVLAVVGIAGFGVLNNASVGPVGPSATGLPSVSPAGTASASDTTGAIEVLSTAQAMDLLARDRASMLGRPIVIDGKLGPRKGIACVLTDPWCVLGYLDGTTEPVLATSYTSAMTLSKPDFALLGPMAFVVRETGLEYLGYMPRASDGGFFFPLTSLADTSSMPPGPMVVVTRGWLVAGLPVPCAAPVPGTPPNTPFEACPPAWLTRDEVQPMVRTPDSVSYKEPLLAFHVQYGAYGDFAPNPGNTSDGLVAPRFGTYLVRLVTDTSQPAATAARGWQVVGRLDPAPWVGPPLSAPVPSLPSLPPDPSATPRQDPVVTCIADPGLAALGTTVDPCPTAIDTALAAASGVTALPVTRLYLQPGIFPCNKHWGEPATCAGPAIIIGAQMYGWIAFDGTDKVAAVQLRRDQPSADAPNPPWTATIDAFVVPPASWSMPSAPTPPYALDCGPLAATPDLCASAATTALAALSLLPKDVTAVTITTPSAMPTCGTAGPPCRRPDVTVTATPVSGSPTSAVPLVRNGFGWMSLFLVR